MIITYKDGRTQFISKKRGDLLRTALLDPNAADFIQIESLTVNKNYIVMLEEGIPIPDQMEHVPFADRPDRVDRRKERPASDEQVS